MRSKLILLTLAIISFRSISAQENSTFQKQCRISAGNGYADAMGQAKNGSSFFAQMSYQVSPKFSVATEFEHIYFERPGYYPDLPVTPNIQRLFDDYFSVLIKYHLPIDSKFRVALASGWTFYTRQNEYYTFYQDATSRSITHNMYSFSDFGIPFLLETEYPVWKNLNAGVRIKYNLNPREGSTYSAGVGLSLKL